VKEVAFPALGNQHWPVPGERQLLESRNRELFKPKSDWSGLKAPFGLTWVQVWKVREAVIHAGRGE